MDAAQRLFSPKAFAFACPPSTPATQHWESYEPEEVQALLSSGSRRHPNGLVLDIGSSVGFYSLVSLFSSPQMHVIAFDSDIGSLKATRRMCRYAGKENVWLLCMDFFPIVISAEKISQARKR